MHPTDEPFGCFTSGGERMAARLVGGVLTDVRGDTISRRAAMVRLADAIDQVSDVDEGITGDDAMASIVSSASQAFDEVGFKPVTAAELRTALIAQRRNGMPAALVGTPHAVARLAEAAKMVRGSLAVMGDIPGFHIKALQQGGSWQQGNIASPEQGASLFVQIASGEETFSGVSTLSCVIAGPQSAQFLDLLTDITPESLVGSLGIVSDDEHRSTRAIRRAAGSVASFNLAAQLIGASDRLGLHLSVLDGIPEIAVRWDGCLIPAEALRSGARIQMLPLDPLDSIGAALFGEQEVTPAPRV